VSAPTIEQGWAALRDGDAATARRAFELAPAEAESGAALEDQRRLLYERLLGEGVLPKLLLIKLGARPAGGDSKEIDEVIELMKQVKVDDFKVPLELLAGYTEVMERWQLEEPVTTLLRRLVATFEPQIAPPAKAVEEIEASPATSTTSDGDRPDDKARARTSGDGE
jgi:hypothetical protein